MIAVFLVEREGGWRENSCWLYIFLILLLLQSQKRRCAISVMRMSSWKDGERIHGKSRKEDEEEVVFAGGAAHSLSLTTQVTWNSHFHRSWYITAIILTPFILGGYQCYSDNWKPGDGVHFKYLQVGNSCVQFGRLLIIKSNMPVFHTKTIESILEPVSVQVGVPMIQ